jgi:hypothetical protein
MNRRHIILATILSGGGAPTYSISGIVYDADGTTPVASATVALGAASTTSAANGTYSITGLAAGTSGSLTCTKTNYVWLSITISAMAADLTGQNFAGIAILLKDQFTTNEASPLATPRTCEPGPGQLTIVNNDWSIASNRLTLANSANGAATVSSAAITRAAGKLAAAKMITDVRYLDFAWYSSGDNTQSGLGTQSGGWLAYWGSPLAGIGIPDTWAAGTPYNVRIVQRSAGVFSVIDDKLAWITYTSSQNPVARCNRSSGNTGTGSWDDFVVAQLPAPWNTDYGIATSQLSGARSAADTFTHEADAFIDFTVTTLPASGTIDMRVRKQGATNYWQVTVDSTGALTLNEVVNGTPTQRGTSAGVIANGDMIRVRMVGTNIHVYEGASSKTGSLRITYTSASSFATATAGLLNSLGTGGAVSDIVAYPRTLSGTALSLLAAVNP